MKKHLISDPMDFHYKEGNAVDFAKTFDLTGNDNDQMLRVYLKKAGLSDNIECLTPEQRKAFIYDIVKSNKNPGYWKPSVLPSMSPNATVRSTHSRVEPSTPDSLASIDDIPPASLTFDFKHFSQLNGEQTVESEEVLVHSPLYERQFQNQQTLAPKVYNTPPTPPSPSTLVTRKGLKIDISGPMNFEHVSGDMTRDMTKNAFDLSAQFNDKCLKKYMIERGIAEEDVEGMDKKELIRKIVQSRYTWMPMGRKYTGSFIPPPPSETYRAPSPTAPPRHKHHSKGGALIVPPPVLPSTDSTSYESIYLEVLPPEPSDASTMRRPINAPPPAPLVVVKNSDKKVSPKHMAPPPPPPQPSNQSQILQVSTKPPIPPTPCESKTTSSGNALSIPPPPPPMPTLSATGGAPPPPPPMPNMNTTGGAPPPPPPMLNMNAPGGAPPPPPPMPNMNASNGSPPLPPPPPLAAHTAASKVEAANKTVEAGGDSRDAFLESIRTGVTLKKVNKGIQVKTSSGTVKLPPNGQPKAPNAQADVPQRPIKAEQPDFMSELRNATLKRIKKLENNPYAEIPSESQC